jgi:hypothetical protein
MERRQDNSTDKAGLEIRLTRNEEELALFVFAICPAMRGLGRNAGRVSSAKTIKTVVQCQDNFSLDNEAELICLVWGCLPSGVAGVS